MIGFIEHLHDYRTCNYNNYNAIADSHTLQFTTVRTKSSQSTVLTGHCLAKALQLLCSAASAPAGWLLSHTWQFKSKSHYDRRSVGQSVLVSSPIWGPWLDFCYCQTFAVLSLRGAISDERTGLSFVAVVVSSTWHLYLQVYLSAFYIVICQESGSLWIYIYYSQFHM
jgi:hypothetical protein